MAWACVLAAGCGPSRPPNLVLISIDTLRPSALHAYAPAAPALPAFDTLAARSVRFDAALSTASWTLPAHGSLLTGLYPDHHGATDQRVALSLSAPLLARSLRDAGYDTAAFTGGGYVGADYGFEVGFDAWEGPTEGEPLDRAADWLGARDPDAPPFFLFVHTYAVHHYFHARPEATARLPAYRDLSSRDYLRCLLGRSHCGREVFRRLEALYAAEVALLDESLGGLLAAVSREGLRDRTVVTLLSDHGEGFDPARVRIHHGGRLHADLLRIPLLVRVPDLSPRAVSQPVSLVDVAPTLLELAGVPRPRDLDGRSLVPLLRGSADWPPRPLFAMEHYYAWSEGERLDSPSIQPRPLALAVVTDGLWYTTGPHGEALYATSGDPEQRHELLRGSLAPARADLAQLRAAAGQHLSDRPDTPRVDFDSGLRDELRSLGYLE